MNINLIKAFDIDMLMVDVGAVDKDLLLSNGYDYLDRRSVTY